MKIAIVGAGICGLYLAWKLTEKGNDVTVFEKRGEIGKEACSGLFSERILDFIPESKKLIQNQIDFCLIHFPKKTIKIKFTRRFFVMSHYQLDNLAADLAEKSGAKIIKNRGLAAEDIVNLEKEFDRIIGSDGAASEVRKSLGLAKPSFRLGIQGFDLKKNLEGEPSAPYRTDTLNYVDAWPTKYGFLWKIPRGEEVEWGVIEKLVKARKIFEEFLREKDVGIANVKSALVPQGLIIPNNSKITLCGESAGLTKPWSGGGVIWGLTAADLLLKNFPDFLKYRNGAKKFFLPKIIFSKITTSMVYFFGFNIPYLIPNNVQIESDFLI